MQEVESPDNDTFEASISAFSSRNSRVGIMPAMAQARTEHVLGTGGHPMQRPELRPDGAVVQGEESPVRRVPRSSHDSFESTGHGHNNGHRRPPSSHERAPRASHEGVAGLPSPLDIKNAAAAIERVSKAEKKQKKCYEKEQPGSWQLHPAGSIRQNWDICTMLIIAYSAMAIPFDVAFTPEDVVHDYWFVIFNWSIDIFFWVDIILNFRTGIEDDDHQFRFGQKEIVTSYMKGWFWIDLVTGFPYDFIIKDEHKERLPKMLRVLRLQKLIKLIKLVKIVRIVRVIQRLEYSWQMQEGLRHVVAFLVILVTLTHWFSCLFYSLGEFDKMEGDDGSKCWANGYDLCGDDIFTNYVAACYWSIMTLTTVGYGDVSAVNIHQRILGILAMICGALIFAYGVSQVVNIVEDMRAESKAFKTRMDKFNTYMANRNLPQDLRGDIREFMHNIRRRQKLTIKDEEYLLKQLSMGLRSRIALAINESYLKEMPFFLGADVELTMDLALRMESFYYAAYEDVVRVGEEGEEMFFIIAGACEVLIGATEVRVAVLIEKQFFGETALLLPEGQRKRNATVRCLQFCEFRSLRTDHFQEILDKFPNAKEMIQQLSLSRQAQSEKTREMTSDGGGPAPNTKTDLVMDMANSQKLTSPFALGGFDKNGKPPKKSRPLQSGGASARANVLEIGGSSAPSDGAVEAQKEKKMSGWSKVKSGINAAGGLPPSLVLRLESIEKSQQDTALMMSTIQQYILNKDKDKKTRG